MFSESGVALAGDHAVERAPVTGEFNPLHVVPGEPAESQKRFRAQIEGVVTANVGNFLALEVRRCFHFDVTGHGDAETEAGDGGGDHPDRLRPPLAVSEHQHAFRTVITGDTTGTQRHPAGAQRRHTGYIVFAGENTH